MNLLAVDHLSIHFADKEVVHDISFSIAPGEKLALVGESGSGKSVTALSLLGLAEGATLEGQVHFEGQELLGLTPRQRRTVRGRDIAMIFQEPMTALNPVYSVGFQIAEVLRIKMAMSRRQAWRRAIELLRDTGIPEPERRAGAYPHQLSGGQRQRAMIAMALACEPKLLVADEPTTALDVTLRLQILELLTALQRKNGMAILIITHDLNLVRSFADRIAVMKHGRIVEQGKVGEVFDAPRDPYTRELIASRPERIRGPLASAAASAGTPLLRARDLQVAYRTSTPGLRNLFRKSEFLAVKNANFQLFPGETLGVIGESGSGKTTLAMAALGLIKHRGELLLDGASWRAIKAGDSDARKSHRRNIQVVFQDPYSSLSPRLNVEEIVGESLRFHEPGLSHSDIRSRVSAILAEVGLTESRFPSLLQRFPHEFSGGQRQRIAIARSLIVSPRVLVLDEPTSALDVTIQKQVLTLLQSLQSRLGLSYLLITHDVDVIRAMADRLIVMKDGVIVEHGDTNRVLRAPLHSYTRTLVHAASEAPVRNSIETAFARVA